MSALAIWAALAAASPATAPAPPADIAFYLGTFAVEDEDGHRLCTATLRWEPDVGGEIAADSCEAAVPDLAEAVRAYPDAENGGVTLEDALHGARGRLDEDEAGIIGTMPRGRRILLQPLDPVPVPSVIETARGRWIPQDREGRPLRRGCTIDLLGNGHIAASKSCPLYWRALRKGRWSAVNDRVTLQLGKVRRTYAFGGDPTAIAEQDGATQLARPD